MKRKMLLLKLFHAYVRSKPPRFEEIRSFFGDALMHHEGLKGKKTLGIIWCSPGRQ